MGKKNKTFFRRTLAVLLAIMAATGVLVLAVSYQLFLLSKDKINTDWIIKTEKTASGLHDATDIGAEVKRSAEESGAILAVLFDHEGNVCASSASDTDESVLTALFDGARGDDNPFDLSDDTDEFHVLIVESNMVVFKAPVPEDRIYCLAFAKSSLYASLDSIYNIAALAIASVFIAILSLFVYIDSKHRENEELYNDVRAIADIYVDMTKVDFKADTMSYMKKSEQIGRVLDGQVEKFSERAMHISSEMAADQSRDILLSFLDPQTIRERLRNVNSLSHEFMDINNRWIRIHFIVVDRDEEGLPEHAIMAFLSIDEDKKQQEKLRQLSETDMMTGIRNRGSGEAEIKRQMSDGVPGMFCLLDADRFKSVNDTFGHGVGDKVIKAIAESMRSTFRDSDVVFRLGGDEFAAFAKGVTDASTGQIIVDRLFENIDRIDIPELQGRKISVSLGASFYPADRNDSFEAMYKRADSGTYSSKKTEGNSVTFREYENEDT